MRFPKTRQFLRRFAGWAVSFVCMLSLLACVGICVIWRHSYRPERPTYAAATGDRRYEARAAGGRLVVTRIDGLSSIWSSPLGAGDFANPQSVTRSERAGVAVERGAYEPNPNGGWSTYPTLASTVTPIGGGSTILYGGGSGVISGPGPIYSGWGGSTVYGSTSTFPTITSSTIPIGSALVFNSFPQPTAVRVSIPWRWPALAFALPPALWVATRLFRARAARRRAWRLAAGRCVGCGYDLRASPDRCPECGREGAAAPAPTPMVTIAAAS